MTVPATGVFDVTCDVPCGFVVVHVTVTLQLLAPDGMLHEGVVSVPDIAVAAWHVVPFHVVPDAQLEVDVPVARSMLLL